MITENQKKFFICSGRGFDEKHSLVAFDNALLNAGISNYNLLKVSSILPANCIQVQNIDLVEGAVLPTAYARMDCNQPGRMVSTAVGVAIPTDPNSVGVIMEYSGYCSAEESKQQITDMLQKAMKNHNISYQDLLISSIDSIVPKAGFLSLISALSFW